MYRERLVATQTHSDSARRLRQLLLDYHDFRQYKATHSLLEHTFQIADWQAKRLKTTHADLYQHPGYHTGLEFLLTDLYAPAGMTRRDDNIDRVFPKMVKWLPLKWQTSATCTVSCTGAIRRSVTWTMSTC
jgi:hypothetical protein